MRWGWRTKPRSALKVIKWFKSFAELENENWDYLNGQIARNGKAIHPIRRKYYYNAQMDEDDSPIKDLTYEEYLSGCRDGDADSESNARNDLATYKFLGLGWTDKNGIIRITQAGRMISENKFDSEMFLKQLLKMSFPSVSTGNGRNITKGKRVFPLQIIIKLLTDLTYINRYEMAFSYFCCDISEYPLLLDTIKKFRKDYEKLDNKNDIVECKKIFMKYAVDVYNFSKDGEPDTLFTTGDAIERALQYTMMFDISGRGNSTKTRIAEHSKKKIELLRDKFIYKTINTEDLDEYMLLFGNLDNIILPWENNDERKALIVDKLNLLENTIHIVKSKYSLEINLDYAELYSKANKLNEPTDLKLFEEELISKITSLNEEVFIKYISKTDEAREQIKDKFSDILDGKEEIAALWLECNTWKSLVAIDGNQKVVRNFSIEEDLTPKSFAPGKNNTPDMELYIDDTILIPEVSLMSGVQQWEHEGSSVIDHVMKFINSNSNKNILGLFISNSINIRTNWQFFLLNKESWMGNPVPVIPLTIKQYSDIITFIYTKSINIKYFVDLINTIHSNTLELDNYQEWNNCIENVILDWKKQFS